MFINDSFYVLTMKKGMYFAIDAFLAAMIVVLGIIIASTFFINKNQMTPLASLSHDFSQILASMNVSNVRNEYLDQLRSSGILSPEEEKYSLSEFIARLYTEGRKTEVALLMQNLSGSFIPANLQMQFVIDGEFAFSTSNSSPLEVVAARSMVTGIDIKKPVSGFTSRAYVAGNTTKKEIYYDTLSGSLGYGNVTKILRGLPPGISVQNLRVALDAANASRWYINGVNCLNMSSGFSLIDTGACNSRFGSGNDTLQILFQNTSSEGVQSFRGGMIEINYTATIPADHSAPASQRFYLDGIDGLINLKTGIYAKGNGTTVSVFLRWRNFGAGWDYDEDGDIDRQPTLLLRFGNKTVFETWKSGADGLWLDSSYFSQFIDSKFSNTTLPVYLGYSGIEPGQVRGGYGDVILSTETSASLRWDYWSSGEGDPGDCQPQGSIFGGGAGIDVALFDKRRLSYVKCGLQQMIDGLLSPEYSRVGLSSFDASVSNATKVGLTRNTFVLRPAIGNDSPVVSGYDTSASWSACVCCAINDARNTLVQGLQRATVVYNHSVWKYYASTPPVDSKGRDWKDPLYDDASWPTGTAVFGSGFTQGQAITTNWGSIVGVGSFFPSLAEALADRNTPQVEFTNGYNFSGNTFGVNGTSDGWDSQCGAYSPAQSCNISSSYVWINTDPNLDGDQRNNSVATYGELRTVYTNASSVPVGSDNSLLSAGFGIDFNINATAMATLSSNGWATLKFKTRISQDIGSLPTYLTGYRLGIGYDWHSMWIKARIGNNISNMYFIGADIDRGNKSRDNTSELFWCMAKGPVFYTSDGGATLDPFTNTCDPDIKNLEFEVNVTNEIIAIGSTGNYYIEFVSILNNSLTNLGGNFNHLRIYGGSWTIAFDDIQILIANKTQEYYLRKTFNWNSPFNAEYGIANVLSDDFASVWVNQHRVDADTTHHSDQYWNRRGKLVKGSWIQNGSNVVAAMVTNGNGQSKFDADVSLLSKMRSRDVVVSIDDSATTQCPEQNTGSASGDAVKAACGAMEGYGVRTHVVGASQFVNASLISAIAGCGTGYSFVPSDPATLMSFYESLARTLSYDAQNRKDWTSVGALIWGKSILYPDSFIEVGVTPSVSTHIPGEIIIEKDLGVVAGCRGRVTIPPKVRVVDSYLVNVPGPSVNVNVNVSPVNYYRWESWGTGFNMTGSPEKVYVPFRNNGSFNIVHAMSPSNCPAYGKVQGKIAAKVISDYSPVLPKNEGCVWRIMTISGASILRVPENYTGSAWCRYFPGVPGIIYDVNSSVQAATFDLLKKIDWDDDLRVDLDIPLIQVQLDTVSIPAIPYMWGPAIVEVRAWY